MKRWRLVGLMNYDKAMKEANKVAHLAWDILRHIPEYRHAYEKRQKLIKRKNVKSSKALTIIENSWGVENLRGLKEENPKDECPEECPKGYLKKCSDGPPKGCPSFAFLISVTRYLNRFVYSNSPVVDFEGLDDYCRGYLDKSQKQEILYALKSNEWDADFTATTIPVAIDLHHPKTLIDRCLRSSLIKIKRTFKPKSKKSKKPRYYGKMKCTSDNKLYLTIDLSYPVGKIVESVKKRVVYYQKKKGIIKKIKGNKAAKKSSRKTRHHYSFLVYLLHHKAGMPRKKVDTYLTPEEHLGSSIANKELERHYKQRRRWTKSCKF
jgi:hypothetical protein